MKTLNAIIMVKSETRSLMKHIARKDQNYDDLIMELIQFKQGEEKK